MRVGLERLDRRRVAQARLDRLHGHAGYSFELLGRPVYEASDFPTFTGTTGAANILVVGDWSNYIIFDRIGSTRVELVPHLLGSNGRPTGQRGILAYFRTGADVASTGANPGFKLLINS